MSMVLLRLGLWSLVAVLVVYVVTETLPSSIIAEMITGEILYLVARIALAIAALGLLVGLAERLWKLRSNKCRTCGRKIPSTAIYCRIHLNKVLEEEDLRHRTMNTKLPE